MLRELSPLRARHNRRRLHQARREVEALTPTDPEQHYVRNLVLAMLHVIEILHCRPGRAQAFAQGWQDVEFFRQTLTPADTAPSPLAEAASPKEPTS